MNSQSAGSGTEWERFAEQGGTPPEWIELIPAGTFSGRDGRGPYRLESPDEVARASAALQMDAGLPIDYDHATDLGATAGRPAPAAGWIKELSARDGALWGRVEWTPHGAAALATKEYRYVSPVFEHDANGVVVRLLRAALTNNPNLYVRAIAARREAVEGAELGGGAGALLGELRAALELPAAGAAEVVAAVRRLRAAAGGAADGRERFVALEHFQKTATELYRVKQEQARERAEHLVQEAMRAGKIVPAQREWALEYCTADREGFEAFVRRQPALDLSTAPLAGRVARDGATAGEELTALERAVCARLAIRPADFLKRKALRGGIAGADGAADGR